MKSAIAVVAGLTVIVSCLIASARAADAGALPPAARDWSGLYVGASTGYGDGSLGHDAAALPLQGLAFPPSPTGLLGGLQAGFNHQFANRWVLGVETDATFAGALDRPTLMSAPFNTTLDYIATARGRIGYAFGVVMPYLTGGFAWGQTEILRNGAGDDVLSSHAMTQTGWTAGLGLEVAVGGGWSARLEYDYLDIARRVWSTGDPAQPSIAVDPSLHLFKLGMNYSLGGNGNLSAPALPKSDDWNVHGQTTIVPSAYPSFRSPYQGMNSLPGTGQARETWTTTAFLGWRLWSGGEFYFDPETAQGFGIGGTVGLAGFPNGEAQKAGGAYPKVRAQRYFLRQTFGLGGEQEDVADGPNQLPGKRDINRITLTIGRFAVGDIFDANAYAKDPRADFMNWALWSSAAYDFPADLPGYTRGAVIELNRKDWALRAGIFQVPAAPNSDVLTFHGGGGAVVEFESRYALDGEPGKLRLGAFANRGNTGNYSEALELYAADPMLDINTIMTGIRRGNLKYGFYLNAEQQLMKDVGLFARASWNDGRTEILSFTDIDRSLSGGVSIKGSFWRRPDDTIGVGGAINGLSAAHRDFLAAGGYGLLIGDGRLNYRPEQILETYYAYAVNKGLTLTADYQLIVNPAYNADRGPASVFSGRIHGEF